MKGEPRFAWNGGSTVAYEVVGDGPLDLVYIPGFINNLEVVWDNPLMERFLRRLSSSARLIMIDRRGMGLSDRLSPEDLPPIEDLVDDIDAVLDVVGSEQAVILGSSDCGAIAAMYAASHPDRTAALIAYASSPSFLDAGEWGTESREVSWDESGYEKFNHDVRTRWGTRGYAEESLAWVDPSLKDDEAMVTWWGRFQRLCVSPTTMLAIAKNYVELDVRPILPAIGVPALVIHRTGDLVEPIAAGREFARLIPGASFVELPGADHHPWAGDQDAVLSAIERFLKSVRQEQTSADRVLATVLFTDIVDSTSQASAMGDETWRGIRESHDMIVRGQLRRFRGREIKTMGDGFLAVFDGPARAVRCARSIVGAMSSLGIEVRCGLHTGEIELDGSDVSGIAVAIGARVGALSGPSEVLVSQTVKDLVVGSGLVFEDRGTETLKGVPDTWNLYAAVDAPELK
jgi:pimeloyl-ACP methyl ester carboxylesterase/class 3 adenylate cyclase